MKRQTAIGLSIIHAMCAYCSGYPNNDFVFHSIIKIDDANIMTIINE